MLSVQIVNVVIAGVGLLLMTVVILATFFCLKEWYRKEKTRRQVADKLPDTTTKMKT